MRILSFNQRSPKLQQDEFSTFRFKRRDIDWAVGEVVQIVFKPWGKEREILGIAEIVGKEARRIFPTRKLCHIPLLTEREAIRDGFIGWGDFALWLVKAYGHKRVWEEPMNKLLLRWIKPEPIFAPGSFFLIQCY